MFRFSPFRQFLASSLLSLGIVFFWIHFFSSLPEDEEKTLWILDTSLSMGVEDIERDAGVMMSRLEYSKLLIEEILPQIPGKHALISYARDARIESPFSHDRDHLLRVLDSLNLVEIYGGSDLQNALAFADTLYANELKKMRVIIITDGGDSKNNPLSEHSKKLSGYIVGVGTEVGGKIPLGYTALGEKRYKYYSGSEIISRYDRASLQKISSHFGLEITTPQELLSIPIKSSSQKDNISLVFLILGTLALITGYSIFPYAKKS